MLFPSLDFVGLANPLIHDANDVEDGVDSEDEKAKVPPNQPSPVAVPPPTLTSVQSQHSKPKGIPLKDLFSLKCNQRFSSIGRQGL